MQDASDAVPSGMVSILGLEREQVQKLCDDARAEGEVLQIANYLCPGNIVVSGHKSACTVVASLAETTYSGYRVGFPGAGRWREAFNSDVYDHWVNPQVAGNGGAVWADGPPLHGLPASAEFVLPANGLLVFTCD